MSDKAQAEEEPVMMEDHPKKGILIKGATGRWCGSAIGETKDCQGCQHIRSVISTRQTGHVVTPEKLAAIIGICNWGVASKIIWQVNKPKKCLKVNQESPRQVLTL